MIEEYKVNNYKKKKKKYYNKGILMDELTSAPNWSK